MCKGPDAQRSLVVKKLRAGRSAALCVRATAQHELGDGARPGRASQATLRKQDFIQRIQDAVGGLGEELHGLICLLEGSLWLLCVEGVGERKGYCLLVSSTSDSQGEGPGEVSMPGGFSPGKAPQHGSPLSPSLLLS